MADGIMISIGDDGVAKIYDDTYDITIHCKSEEEQDEVVKRLRAGRDFDEWCTDCKEYDHERHCCPRYNRIIRETLAEIREVPSAEPKIIYCKDCKFARLTDRGEVKYCDVWSPDDKVYMDAETNFCSCAERREA